MVDDMAKSVSCFNEKNSRSFYGTGSKHRYRW